MWQIALGDSSSMTHIHKPQLWICNFHWVDSSIWLSLTFHYQPLPQALTSFYFCPPGFSNTCMGSLYLASLQPRVNTPGCHPQPRAVGTTRWVLLLPILWMGSVERGIVKNLPSSPLTSEVTSTHSYWLFLLPCHILPAPIHLLSRMTSQINSLYRVLFSGKAKLNDAVKNVQSSFTKSMFQFITIRGKSLNCTDHNFRFCKINAID